MVAETCKRIVGDPSIRVYCRPGFYHVLHKSNQAGSRHIRNSSKADPAQSSLLLALSGDRDDCLLLGLATTDSCLVTSKVTLIDLHASIELIPVWAYHRPPELMKMSPCGLVALEAHDTPEAQRVRPLLLVRYVPNGSEPCSERRLCRVEYCPSGDLWIHIDILGK